MSARLTLAFAILFSLSAQAVTHAPTADKKRPPPGPDLTDGLKLKFEVPEELEDRKLGHYQSGTELMYIFKNGEVKKTIDPTAMRADLILTGPADKFRLDLIRPAPTEPPETSRLRKGTFSGTVKVRGHVSEVAGKKYYGNEVLVEFDYQGLKGKLYLYYFTRDQPHTFTLQDLKRTLGTNILVTTE